MVKVEETSSFSEGTWRDTDGNGPKRDQDPVCLSARLGAPPRGPGKEGTAAPVYRQVLCRTFPSESHYGHRTGHLFRGGDVTLVTRFEHNVSTFWHFCRFLYSFFWMSPDEGKRHDR